MLGCRKLLLLVVFLLVIPTPVLAIPIADAAGQAAGGVWDFFTKERDISNVPLLGDALRAVGKNPIGNAVLKYGLGINVDTETGKVTTTVADMALNALAVVGGVGIAAKAIGVGARAARIGTTVARAGRFARAGTKVSRFARRGVKIGKKLHVSSKGVSLRTSGRLKFLRKPLTKLYGYTKRRTKFRLFGVDKGHRWFKSRHIHSVITDPIVRRIKTTNRVLRRILPVGHLSIKKALGYTLVGRTIYKLVRHPPKRSRSSSIFGNVTRGYRVRSRSYSRGYSFRSYTRSRGYSRGRSYSFSRSISKSRGRSSISRNRGRSSFGRRR